MDEFELISEVLTFGSPGWCAEVDTALGSALDCSREQIEAIADKALKNMSRGSDSALANEFLRIWADETFWTEID